MNDNNHDKKASRFAILLRIAAGGYLIYIAWQLREAVATHTGIEKAIFIMFIILFAAVGIFLCAYSIRKYLKGDFLMPGEDGEKEETSDEDNEEL